MKMDVEEERMRIIVGSRIMQRRKQLGIKQKALAEKVGLTDNQVSNIENGVSFPRLGNFIRICDVLNTTPDYFIAGIIRQNVGGNITDLIAQCTPEEQRTILLLLDTFLHRADKNEV